MAGGYAMDRILKEFPELTADDVSAALKYAGDVIDEEKVVARV